MLSFRKLNTSALIFLLYTVFPLGLMAESRDSGPLYGKTFYLPYSIYLQGPESRAKIPEKATLTYRLESYYLNDNKVIKTAGEYNAIRDYESSVQEISLEYIPINNLKITSVFRVQEVFGGFMDSIIEDFHNAFNFPNGGREYIPRNSVSIDIENSNGVVLRHQGTAAAFCDTEFWVQYTFLSLKWLDLAGSMGFKIPTGALSGISIFSSGYVDFNLSLLADFYAGRFFSFYIQAGLSLPMDAIIPGSASSPYPFFTGKIAAEFHPWNFISIIAQMNIKSPSMSGGPKHWLFKGKDMLDLPQTNLLVGFTLHFDHFRWQFYFEEDVITNQGNDIMFNLSFTHRIPLIKP